MTRSHALPPVSLALIALVALEVAHQFSGASVLGWAAVAAMGLSIALAAPRLGLREAYLLTLSAGVALCLWVWHPDPLRAAVRALDQAVFLMAFLLSISLIQEAAQTSQSVAALGRYLANQPGGRRYVGLYAGTSAMSVVFNIGTLSLLAPLITRAAEAAPDDPLTRTRERRQLNAVLRGFAWSVAWSPTAIAPLALFALLPDADRLSWIGLGLGLAAVMLAVGWAEDRLAWRGLTAEALGRPPLPVPPLPRRAVLRFLAVCFGLATIAGALMLAGGVGVPAALMAASPLVMLEWLWAQPINPWPRVGEILRQDMPATAPAAVTLGAAGFVGIAGADLLPAQAIADWIDLGAAPAWLFLTGTVVAVLVLSQFGLSPIMMAVFFGAVLSSLDDLPADATLTALAVSTGLAVATTASPFAAGVVFLARVTRHSGPKLTYGWNGFFSAKSIAILAVAFSCMTGGR